ncbi:hypothetical protein GQ457_17G014470 [Hibiscus cannabinus]
MGFIMPLNMKVYMLYVLVVEIPTPNEGSWFNLLVVEDGEDQQCHAPDTQLSIIVEPRVVEPLRSHPLSNMGIEGNVNCKGSVDASSQGECGASITIVAKDKIVSVPSSLKSYKHTAIRVIEEGQSQVLEVHNGCPSYGPIRSATAKGTRRSSVAFSNSLTKEGLTVASSSDGSDERPSMNTQGNIGLDFNRFFKLLISSHVSEILAVIGGIWVMWKDTVHLDVVAVSNHFLKVFA